MSSFDFIITRFECILKVKSCMQNTSLILTALADAKLMVNFKNSEFFKTKVTFPGRVLDGTT